MGRIVAKIKVENLEDILRAERGELSPSKIRSVEMDALVDPGATLLCLPAKAIANWGLSFLETRVAVAANGPGVKRVFRSAQLTILNRTCTTDVMEVEDDLPALVVLDLKVDPKK